MNESSAAFKPYVVLLYSFAYKIFPRTFHYIQKKYTFCDWNSWKRLSLFMFDRRTRRPLILSEIHRNTHIMFFFVPYYVSYRV